MSNQATTMHATTTTTGTIAHAIESLTNASLHAYGNMSTQRERLSKDGSVTHLAGVLNELAGAEAAWLVYHHTSLVLANRDVDATETDVLGAVRQYLTEVLLEGADDTWSGRGNDLARVCFDAKREAVKQSLRILARVGR
jgi:hypothetical protein